jgi:hypothetical protein
VRLALAALALAFLSTAFPAAAAAKTSVSVDSTGTLEVIGGFLEHQHTVIHGPNTPGSSGVYDVIEADPGGPHETAGAGCFVVNVLEVNCPASGVRLIHVLAESLDDKVDIGPGVPAPTALFGGTGDDILRGGSENDAFFNEATSDGADQFYGEGGNDTVNYGERSKPVTVVLDSHSNDGAPGENDFVSGDIAHVVGGQGADTLIGNSASNILDGFGGDDHVTGGSGADQLIGGPGNDILDDDLDSTADRFACGPGTDSAFLDLKDSAASDCEKVSISAIDQHPNVAIKVGAVVRIDRHQRVELPLVCPPAQRHGCHGRLTLKRGRRQLGSRRYSLRPGKRTKIALELTRSAAGRVQATALERDPKGRPKTTIARFRLKAR